MAKKIVGASQWGTWMEQPIYEKTFEGVRWLYPVEITQVLSFIDTRSREWLLGVNIALGNPLRADSEEGRSWIASRPRVTADAARGQCAETAAHLAVDTFVDNLTRAHPNLSFANVTDRFPTYWNHLDGTQRRRIAEGHPGAFVVLAVPLKT